jgi:hypothetical protein
MILVGAVIDLKSQIPPPTNDTSEQRREAEQRSEAERELRMRQMREFDTTMKPLTRPRPSMPAVPTIDKETSERIRLARTIDVAHLSRYSEFLKTDKTGVFKLFPDHDCVTNNVIRIDGDCKDFVMASSSFSFRTGSYVHPYYHDLGFVNGKLLSDAFFSQGIFVSLGDVPIEDVRAGSAGLKFLFGFQTAADPGTAKSSAAEFQAGTESGGYKYSSSVEPRENTTYALRSIAYEVANSLPTVAETNSLGELRFHTLSLDKRADVIIAFRIIRKGTDGSLMIVWKELNRREAPKIKFRKNEKLADFRPDKAVAHHEFGMGN